MTSIGYFLVLIAALQCLSSADDGSGSGDNFMAPDAVIVFISDEEVNCSEIEVAVVNGYTVFNDSNDFTVKQISNSRKRSVEFNYIGYAVHDDEVTPNDAKTIEIKMEMCMDPAPLMNAVSIEIVIIFNM